MGISVDLSGLKLDKFTGKKHLEDANLLVTNKVKDDTEKFVPMDHGDLRGNVEVDVDSFTYTEEYADYVYNMNPFNNFSTPGTTSHWIEPSKSENMSEWERFAAKAVLGEV